MSSDTGEQVNQIGSALQGRLDELAQRVTSLVRTNVDVYKTRLVTDEELLASTTNNLRHLFAGLRSGESFDTTPAVATGPERAASGVPLPAVMAAFRVACHHLWDAMVEMAGRELTSPAMPC